MTSPSAHTRGGNKDGSASVSHNKPPSNTPSIRDWSRFIPDNYDYQHVFQELHHHVSHVYPNPNPNLNPNSNSRLSDNAEYTSNNNKPAIVPTSTTISYSNKNNINSSSSALSSVSSTSSYYDSLHPELSVRAQEAANLHSSVHAVETGINEVRTAEEKVRQGTVQLREACESLVRERGALKNTASSLDHGLAHFELLEAADGELRHGTVGSERFLGMLAAVDQAIAFLTVHRDYRESHEYLQQYRHVQRRGLAALRDIVVQELQELGGDKDDATHGGSMSYVRFSAAAERLGRLIRELERRGSEGKVLVADCLHKYVMERGPSLAAAVGLRVGDLLAAEASLTTFVRAVAPQFLVQLARDEYSLFNRYFDISISSSGEESLSGFVEMVQSASEEVYSGVRTLIVHEDDVDELCDAVEELRGEAMERASEHAVLRRALVPVLHRIAADIQERLIFRVSTAISNMRSFPSSEEGLEALERFPRVLQRPPAVRADAWYPPVERTLWLLGRMHRILDRGVFEGLAPEAVNVCGDVIVKAGNKLMERVQNGDEFNEHDNNQDQYSETENGKRGEQEEQGLTMAAISGNLFIVRHLVILREQTSPFNLPSSSSPPSSASSSSASPQHTPRSPLSLSSVLSSLFASKKESVPSYAQGQGGDGVTPTPRIDALIKQSSQAIVDASVDGAAQELEPIRISSEVRGAIKNIGHKVHEIRRHIRLFLGGMPVQDLLLRSVHLGVKDRVTELLSNVDDVSLDTELCVAGLQENSGEEQHHAQGHSSGAHH